MAKSAPQHRESSAMMKKHSLVISMMNRDRSTAYLLRDYFDLRRGTTLMASLLQRGLGQADLVLALLRLRDQHRRPRRLLDFYVTMLVGHPIQVGPSCLRDYRSATTRTVRSRDDRRITFVIPGNPRAASTEAHDRWCEFMVGRTLGQLLVRGVTKRDIRRSLRKGWIKVEELA
jgi:hypothetical protein